MEVIYILLCNSYPIAVSRSMEKLEEIKNERINMTEKDSNFEVIDNEKDSITYHTGISYKTDSYEIISIPIL